MRLDVFKTLWGDFRPWGAAIKDMTKAGFTGIEARIPASMDDARQNADVLAGEGIPYIAIAMTGGGVIPQQAATIEDHLADLQSALERALCMKPRFINVLGGNDRWSAPQQAEFINRAHAIGQEMGLLCSFETHRSRILATPWITMDVLPQLADDILFTADISHWVVSCERLLNDPLDDFSAFLSRVHHVQARVGYDQGPQVPHPAAPEYEPALRFHQHIWEQIWLAQKKRGYAVTTLTPECGPDGYLHTLPFTNAPIADLWSLNVWMGQTEQAHFKQFTTLCP
ncbi:sugar phosphate isomerase/epimerase family protein [Acetobacter senegalensis]|uniref:sugar phosphate isomerase/epimerase family protein n=1 Tax=Acetobacter senegalensis TaxID=446692 RepID=UPI00128C82E2|nr:sugar phosphate isomerase/epimerase [Acetobacter senegalensis]MCG4256400.1 sugar phosphate isomerase/epimerase [Acetobacter senegalensis]MCG4266043.1 sugar phosphate isomerase/epimerase [Acetobacter senegalensis]MPQ73028.1 sugar phosphate isomerase/epimerase [Acetobacter senegalensis]